ncbi:MAG: hypothetical protein AAGG81_03675 [Chlamydiota bacterium]
MDLAAVSPGELSPYFQAQLSNNQVNRNDSEIENDVDFSEESNTCEKVQRVGKNCFIVLGGALAGTVVGALEGFVAGVLSSSPVIIMDGFHSDGFAFAWTMGFTCIVSALGMVGGGAVSIEYINREKDEDDEEILVQNSKFDD